MYVVSAFRRTMRVRFRPDTTYDVDYERPSLSVSPNEPVPWGVS